MGLDREGQFMEPSTDLLMGLILFWPWQGAIVNAMGWGLIPGQRTRSQMLQIRPSAAK